MTDFIKGFNYSPKQSGIVENIFQNSSFALDEFGRIILKNQKVSHFTSTKWTGFFQYIINSKFQELKFFNLFWDKETFINCIIDQISSYMTLWDTVTCQATTFQQSKFHNGLIHEGIFHSTNFDTVIFQGINFQQSIFSEVNFKEVIFLNCRIADVTFENCSFEDVLFDGSIFRKSFIKDSILKQVSWKEEFFMDNYPNLINCELVDIKIPEEMHLTNKEK